MDIKQKIMELRQRKMRKSVMQGINIACDEIEKVIEIKKKKRPSINNDLKEIQKEPNGTEPIFS